MIISKCWQDEVLKDWFYEDEVEERSHLSTLSVGKKGIESDEESLVVDTGACSLISIFFSAADEV